MLSEEELTFTMKINRAYVTTTALAAAVFRFLSSENRRTVFFFRSSNLPENYGDDAMLITEGDVVALA